MVLTFVECENTVAIPEKLVVKASQGCLLPVDIPNWFAVVGNLPMFEAARACVLIHSLKRFSRSAFGAAARQRSQDQHHHQDSSDGKHQAALAERIFGRPVANAFKVGRPQRIWGFPLDDGHVNRPRCCRCCSNTGLVGCNGRSHVWWR